MRRRAPDVLVIDDEEADVEIARAVLDSSSPGLEVRALGDGAHLVTRLEDPDLPVPDLVLLDLKIPGWDGQDLLQRIRRSARWGRTIVVMFSSSTLERDVADAYALGANAYVVKPTNLDGYRKTLGAIVEFWLHTAQRAGPDPALDGR